MVSSALTRVCLLMPSVVGAIGVLSSPAVYAIEPLIATDAKNQSEDNLLKEDYLERELTTETTIYTNVVEPAELLENVELQQLKSTPIAT